ncbi:DHA2 family efflux MFS transporter permease subunit [Candidatus Binatus sp.]|uniref:DHA2 family efflux MFS transporter permease subunit n=1 Tax=Candidatus Binatus sp. TaxID=2811406 RepID=UPI003BAFF0EC
MAAENTSTAAFLTTEQSRQADKWLVAASVLMGTFLSVMDVSVVNVAMPHMMGSFGQDLLTITWVSTAYSIAEIIMITMTAFWSTLLGRKRLFLASMTVFIVGSILAGTSRTFGQMLFYRVLQGAGGGTLIPASQAIVREKFPPSEQAMAMAIYGMGVMLAPTLGPVIGGWLVDNWGWRWIFFVNVPFAVVGILMVSAFVQDPPYLKRGIERIDWIGIALLAVGLTALQIVLERGQEVDWFSSPAIVAGTASAVLALAVLMVWELTLEEPVINFRLLRDLRLSAGSGMGAVLGFALFGSTFLLPELTQEVLGYPAFRAGLVLLPRAVAIFLIMPIAGRLYNYASPRILVGFGMTLLAIAYWGLGHFTLGVGFWNFVPLLVETGVGVGCSTVILSTVSLSSMPPESMTEAAGLYTLVRRVSANIAYAVLATLVERHSQLHRAELVGNVNSLGTSFYQYESRANARLMSRGYNSVTWRKRDIAIVNGVLNRQSTMMAYNDVFTLLSWFFVFALPLILLLPKEGIPPEVVTPTE